MGTERISNPEAGGRFPTGIRGKIVFGVLLAWALFQLWFASPLPFYFDFFVLNDTQARSIHLSFAVFLAFVLFPGRYFGAGRSDVPWWDWLLAGVGALAAGYLYLAYEGLAERPGQPGTLDKTVALVGIPLVLLAAVRSLGPALLVVASAFMAYAFLGPWMPDLVAHRGISFNKAVAHYWMGTEGVFGVPLGVSTTMVFMFVLFGSILDRIGAGNYFIQSSFALLGHLRGGPAKAAVLSSASTGMVSGSSIANVVTTGTFTIPLMKRVGFSPEKAGAIECASSTNGQITPPVMGAAAFLMVEYAGVSYMEVIRAAALPAILAYLALFYIVHLEALKSGIGALPGGGKNPWRTTLTVSGGLVLGFMATALLSYVFINWIQASLGAMATPAILGSGFLIYLGLLVVAAKVPELEVRSELEVIPPIWPTLASGLYFLIPIGVLVWCFAVEQLSPGLSAFWATVVLGAVALTHRPLKGALRRILRTVESDSELRVEFVRGAREFVEGTALGSRNMVGIAVATAAAGLVVGTVTVTGIGLRMTELIGFLSGGNLLWVLFFTALVCLILGMGLPTTANYIVVSSIMAPVIVELGGASGVVIPLIAVHLFVFYFGILADDTPPVGLAAYAAAAIARGKPIGTGVCAFFYDIRTAVLPFLFIFNHELLLIGIESIPHLILTIGGALVGMLCFASATQRFFLGRLNWVQTLLLLAAAFVFFRPGYLLNLVSEPYSILEGSALEGWVDGQKPGDALVVRVVGDTLGPVDEWYRLEIPVDVEGSTRLRTLGLVGQVEGDAFLVEDVPFGTPAFDRGMLFGLKVIELREANDRPAKEWFWMLGLVLIGVVLGWVKVGNRPQLSGEGSG
ncbi:MAG: TRAP transporter permease [Puniceicoccaceae bacterium]